MVNPVRNVARWSALVAGLAYGYNHHNTLVAQEAKRAEEIKNAKHEALVAKAKLEWTKMNTPAGGVITDPENPNFDLEKLLIHLSETA
ncbi:hypothetical protein BGZ73_006937 [Actinomortierella ambigua]|nr:hypothetical protein BGZ73_006937 [Actinomortierella ambigua]